MTDLEVPRSKEPFLPAFTPLILEGPSVMGLIQAAIIVFTPLLKNSTIIARVTSVGDNIVTFCLCGAN